MKSLKKMTPAQVLILIKQIGKYGRFNVKIKINFYNNDLNGENCRQRINCIFNFYDRKFV